MSSAIYSDRTVSQVVRTNLSTNPTNGGAASGGLAPGNSQYHVGTVATYAVAAGWQYILATSIPAAGRVGYSRTEPVSLASGSQIAVSALNTGSVPAGLTARLYVDVLSASAAIVGHFDGPFSAGAVEGGITLTGAATSIKYYIWLEPTSGSWSGPVPTAGFSWYLIEPGTLVPGSSFTGSVADTDTFNYEWLGTPNASASTQTQTTVLAKLPDAQPSVRVTFTPGDLDPDVNTVTLYRTADGQTNPVRTAIGLFAVGGFTAFDGEAPLGVPITYQAEQFDASGNSLGYSASLTAELYAPDPIFGWISDPLDETSAVKVVMTDTAGIAPARAIPGTVYTVGTSSHVLAGVQGKITSLDMGFYTQSADDDAAVLALLRQSNGSVLIRTGPTFGVLTPRALYCFAGAAAPTYLDGNGALWANQVAEISATTQAVAKSNASWTDVTAGYATWTALKAAFPSWLAVEKAFDTT